MAIESKDVTYLQTIFDDRYVQQSDCNDVQLSMHEEIAEEKKELAVAKNDIGGIKKLVWTIAASCIGELVLQFFSVMRGVS